MTITRRSLETVSSNNYLTSKTLLANYGRKYFLSLFYNNPKHGTQDQSTQVVNNAGHPIKRCLKKLSMSPQVCTAQIGRGPSFTQDCPVKHEHKENGLIDQS